MSFTNPGDSNSGISSKSQNSTENQTYSKPVSLQDVQGTTFAGIDNTSVNVLDAGAVSGMMDVSLAAMDAQTKNNTSIFDLVKELQGTALTFSQNASERALSLAANAATPDATMSRNTMIAIGAVAIAAVLAVAWRK